MSSYSKCLPKWGSKKEDGKRACFLKVYYLTLTQLPQFNRLSGKREGEIDKCCSVTVAIILMHWICSYYGYKPLLKEKKCARKFDLTNLLLWRHGGKMFTFNWMTGCRVFLRLAVRRNWQYGEDRLASQARIVYHKLPLNRNANVLFIKCSDFLITLYHFHKFS